MASRDTLSAAAGFLEFRLKVAQGKESQCVRNIDYDEFTGELTVEFQERGTYKYFNVPLSEMANFVGASSKGTYFNYYIRNNYSYERIE